MMKSQLPSCGTYPLELTAHSCGEATDCGSLHMPRSACKHRQTQFMLVYMFHCERAAGHLKHETLASGQASCCTTLHIAYPNTSHHHLSPWFSNAKIPHSNADHATDGDSQKLHHAAYKVSQKLHHASDKWFRGLTMQ